MKQPINDLPSKTIAVDLTPILPGGDNGGAKIFVIELIKQLARVAPNIQFILLTSDCSHEELAELDSQNVRRKLVNSGVKRPLVIRVYHKVCRWASVFAGISVTNAGVIIKDKIDLLFCPFTAPIYHQPSIPTVCTLYDLQYKTYPQFFSPEDCLHRERVFQETLQKADKIIAISHYTKESVRKHGMIDENKIKTIYIQMAHRMADSSTSNNIERPYLLYPANYWQHKNHERLLTAFALAIQFGLADDIQLICTGAPGVRQQQLMQVAETLGLSNRVFFAGFLSNDELGSLLAHALGLIFPSLYEGFGLPVIEAMGKGIPVACSNVTSMPEVAGDAAILFDPMNPMEIAQSMLKLTQDNQVRESFIEAGMRRANCFCDSEKMAKEYLQVFNEAW